MTNDEIRGILDRNPIYDVVNNYVRLIPDGDKYHGKCPFCGHDDAFHVSPWHKVYHCFACHEGGDAFKFLQLHLKVTFAEAVEKLR